MSTNDGWIKMSERKLTEADLPVFAYYKLTDQVEFISWFIPSGATHWQPATLPVPPKKELTQRERDEEAFETWIVNPKTWPELVQVWHAALAYRDKQNAEDLRGFEGYSVPYLSNLRRRCGLDT